MKAHFQIFGEMVQKTLKMRKYHFFFVKYVCMLTDCRGKCNKIVVGTVVCIICMIFVFHVNLLVLYGVVPRLYTQVK